MRTPTSWRGVLPPFFPVKKRPPLCHNMASLGWMISSVASTRSASYPLFGPRAFALPTVRSSLRRTAVLGPFPSWLRGLPDRL